MMSVLQNKRALLGSKPFDLLKSGNQAQVKNIQKVKASRCRTFEQTTTLIFYN